MHERNADIKAMIADNHLYYWQVAERLGVVESTLSTWLRRELTPEKREKIINAINDLKEGE